MALINLAENFKKSILSVIQKSKISSLFLSVITFNLAAAFLFLLFRDDFFYTIHANFFPFDSLHEEFFVVTVIAPLLETTIYQYGILGTSLIFSKLIFKKELIIMSILISVTAYAWSHFNDYVYMIQMMVSGLSYSVFYIIIKKRNKNAFMYSLVVHMLCNLLVFGLMHI